MVAIIKKLARRLVKKNHSGAKFVYTHRIRQRIQNIVLTFKNSHDLND